MKNPRKKTREEELIVKERSVDCPKIGPEFKGKIR
jgi:hypothetical protein